MCGEHCYALPSRNLRPGSSPHVRGAQQHTGHVQADRGIIPACAGSTGALRRPVSHGRDHPRMCGEHMRHLARSRKGMGSSPHVRGAPRHTRPRRCTPGIIPACAGSTRPCADASDNDGDHPRMCGEHGQITGVYRGYTGSSPHVRGALGITNFPTFMTGIIPACAGSTMT